jgi:hypothetical protein
MSDGAGKGAEEYEMNDFDREMEKNEMQEDDREATELAVLDFKRFARNRCCLFLADEDGTVLHGRLEGLLQEIEALVLRDLRPGRERLQCRLQVPYDNVHYACHSGSLEKCKQCAEYERLTPKKRRGAGGGRK